MDVDNIGDPRGINSNRQPGRARNDAKKDKRLQQGTRIPSTREAQARDNWQALVLAPNRKDHGCCRKGPQGEGGTRHEEEIKEYTPCEDGNSYDSQCGPENTDVLGR